MSDYSEYQPGTAPAWMLTPLAEGLLLALGHFKDALTQGAKQAVKCRLPLAAPADALPALAEERNLPQFPSETQDAWRTRLSLAFDLWQWGGTRTGLQAALDGVPYAVSVIKERYEWPDAYPLGWAVFWVVLTSHVWVADSTWGTGVWGDGGTWGSSALLDEINLYRLLVRLWKPAHALCPAIIALLDGELWDDDGDWSNSGVWGGQAVYWLP